MSFISRFISAVRRFMIGRYGTDTLNRHLIVLWCVLAVLNIFFSSLVLYFLELFVSFYALFRALSRNIVKRQRENAAYYRLSSRFMKGFSHVFVRFRDRKTTRFFRCPKCSAPIKMPRKVGRFRIRCQRCGESFVKEFKK